MAFENSYPNRKDRRKPYRRAQAIDRSCRPHGGCPWCRSGRAHNDNRRIEVANGSKDFDDQSS